MPSSYASVAIYIVSVYTFSGVPHSTCLLAHFYKLLYYIFPVVSYFTLSIAFTPPYYFTWVLTPSIILVSSFPIFCIDHLPFYTSSHVVSRPQHPMRPGCVIHTLQIDRTQRPHPDIILCGNNSCPLHINVGDFTFALFLNYLYDNDNRMNTQVGPMYLK